jgi:hypothetical protein
VTPEWLYEQVVSEWKKAGLDDPDKRREWVVGIVAAKLGGHWIARAVVETIYDKAFPPEVEREASLSDGSTTAMQVCEKCGLNDGHHYVSCPNVGRDAAR